MDPRFVIVFALLQLLGVLSTFAARLSEKSPLRQLGQAVFLATWVLVGLAAATSLCLHAGSGYWLSGGTTFCVMAVGATLDLRPRPQSATF